MGPQAPTPKPQHRRPALPLQERRGRGICHEPPPLARTSRESETQMIPKAVLRQKLHESSAHLRLRRARRRRRMSLPRHPTRHARWPSNCYTRQPARCAVIISVPTESRCRSSWIAQGCLPSYASRAWIVTILRTDKFNRGRLVSTTVSKPSELNSHCEAHRSFQGMDVAF